MQLADMSKKLFWTVAMMRLYEEDFIMFGKILNYAGKNKKYIYGGMSDISCCIL